MKTLTGFEIKVLKTVAKEYYAILEKVEKKEDEIKELREKFAKLQETIKPIIGDTFLDCYIVKENTNGKTKFVYKEPQYTKEDCENTDYKEEYNN